MAKFVNQMKLTWLKGVEAVGNTAFTVASNAKVKVQEINLETRKRELLTELSMTAFDLWQKGEPLPAPLDVMLRELGQVDEKLSVLRAQKYAKVESETEDNIAEEENPAERDGFLKNCFEDKEAAVEISLEGEQKIIQEAAQEVGTEKPAAQAEE